MLKYKIKWFFSRKKPCINTTKHGHDFTRTKTAKSYYLLECNVCGAIASMSWLGLTLEKKGNKDA